MSQCDENYPSIIFWIDKTLLQKCRHATETGVLYSVQSLFRQRNTRCTKHAGGAKKGKSERDEEREKDKLQPLAMKKNVWIKIIFQMLSFSSIGFQLHFGRLHRSKVELLSTFFIFQDFEISASITMWKWTKFRPLENWFFRNYTETSLSLFLRIIHRPHCQHFLLQQFRHKVLSMTTVENEKRFSCLTTTENYFRTWITSKLNLHLLRPPGGTPWGSIQDDQ